MLPEEGELVGQVPLGDDAAAARARAVQLVAQVPRVRVADVGPLAPHLRYCNATSLYAVLCQFKLNRSDPVLESSIIGFGRLLGRLSITIYYY